jgi:hypothetical protein
MLNIFSILDILKYLEKEVLQKHNFNILGY